MTAIDPGSPPRPDHTTDVRAPDRPPLSVARRLSVEPRPCPASPATVTVVIPCYNYGRFLPAAVGSAISQTSVTVDVVIVDDASTDDSLAVARRLEAIQPGLTVLAHQRNCGPVDTFNDGLAAATGEFLVRLDADDLLTPGSLARAVAVMRAFPSVGLVYGHPIHFAGDARPAARMVPSRWTIFPGKEWLRDRCRSGLNVITSPEVLMRKSVVDVTGGQRPLRHTHDMEMWLRMAAFCDVAYIHGADQAWHREHADSLSAKHVDALRDLVERREAFDVLFSGPVGSMRGAGELHAMAMEALATDAVELASREFDHFRADPGLVDRLQEIASTMASDVQALRGWPGLQRRMAMGAPWASFYPPFFLHRLVRGLGGVHRRRRWHRNGV